VTTTYFLQFISLSTFFYERKAAMITKHGGNIYAHPNMLDFSANINPLGTPQAIQKAVQHSLTELHCYPDPDCTKLRRYIAQKEHLPNHTILCGNGAADLIFTLCFALRVLYCDNYANLITVPSALLVAPCFSEYAQALRAADFQIDYHLLKESERFCLTKNFLDTLTKKTYTAVFLCNPNNPTGQLIDASILEAIVSYCHKCHIYLILDECFLNFTQNADAASMKKHILGSPYLIILKAFTKMYAIPGLRLGYLLCSDERLMQKMQEMRQPWSVSVPAQAAGIAALNLTDWETKTRDYIQIEKNFLRQTMFSNPDFQLLSGDANFLFFSAPPDFFSFCYSQHILLRCCNNFYGLEDTHFLRMAVHTREEHSQLLDTIQKYREQIILQKGK